MINFCKGADCPSSDDILASQNDAVPSGIKRVVDKHLVFCDFCAAEAEIYSRHPILEERVSETEIPTALLELAESLLDEKQKGNHLLKKLFIENEGLTLKEV